MVQGFAVRPPARKQPTRLPQKVPVVRGFAVRPSAREQPTRLPQRGPLRGLLLALGPEGARQRAIMSTHRAPLGKTLIGLRPRSRAQAGGTCVDRGSRRGCPHLNGDSLLALGREEARQRAIMSTHRVPCGAALIDLGPEAARKRAERALTVKAGEVAVTSMGTPSGIASRSRPGRGAPAGDLRLSGLLKHRSSSTGSGRADQLSGAAIAPRLECFLVGLLPAVGVLGRFGWEQLGWPNGYWTAQRMRELL